MTAMAKLQFCNFVQIFVAAREIHSYVVGSQFAVMQSTGNDVVATISIIIILLLPPCLFLQPLLFHIRSTQIKKLSQR